MEKTHEIFYVAEGVIADLREQAQRWDDCTVVQVGEGVLCVFDDGHAEEFQPKGCNPRLI